MSQRRFSFAWVGAAWSLCWASALTSGCSPESSPLPWFAASHTDSPLLSESGAFVKVHGERLGLGEHPYFFSGANQYYFFYKDRHMIDTVLADAAALGLNTLRTWAFCDGQWHDGHSFQPAPRVFHEPTFQQLDYTIYRAGKLGIRLILPLVNYWPEFGGMEQYIRWSPTAKTRDDFYTDPECQALYRDYVRHVLTRVNSISGVPYKDDPSILMWELANEPRADDPQKLYAWIDSMAGYIKELDPNHLVSTGSEGGYATDFVATHRSAAIDAASLHLYPEPWGKSEADSLLYIQKHIDQARDLLHKPVYLGEMGVRKRESRDRMYLDWYNLANQQDLNGMLLWILSGKMWGYPHDQKGEEGKPYPDYDGFTVYYPEDKKTAFTLRAFGDRLRQKNDPILDLVPPSVALQSPGPGSTLRGEVLIAGQATDDGPLSHVEIDTGSGWVKATGTAPFRLIWDTSAELDGEHLIQAKAVDGQGNVQVSALRATVRNLGVGAGDFSLAGAKDQDDPYNFIYWLRASNRSGQTKTGRFVFRFYLTPKPSLTLRDHYEQSEHWVRNPQVSGLKQGPEGVFYYEIDLGPRTLPQGAYLGYKGGLAQATGQLQTSNDWSSSELTSLEKPLERIALFCDGRLIAGRPQKGRSSTWPVPKPPEDPILLPDPIPAPPAPPWYPLLDDFDGYDGHDALPRLFYLRQGKGNEIALGLDSAQHDSGGHGLLLTYQVGVPGFAGLTRKMYHSNWSSTRGLRFWLLPNATGHTLAIQFRETDGEYWEAWFPLVDRSAGVIEAPWSSFFRPDWSPAGNGAIDLGSIAELSINLSLGQGQPGSGTVTLDSFSLLPE